MQTIEFSIPSQAGELAAYISALIDHDVNFSVRRDEIAVAVTITGKKVWTR